MQPLSFLSKDSFKSLLLPMVETPFKGWLFQPAPCFYAKSNLCNSKGKIKCFKLSLGFFFFFQKCSQDSTGPRLLLKTDSWQELAFLLRARNAWREQHRHLLGIERCAALKTGRRGEVLWQYELCVIHPWVALDLENLGTISYHSLLTTLSE